MVVTSLARTVVVARLTFWSCASPTWSCTETGAEQVTVPVISAAPVFGFAVPLASMAIVTFGRLSNSYAPMSHAAPSGRPTYR